MSDRSGRAGQGSDRRRRTWVLVRTGDVSICLRPIRDPGT